MDARIDQRCAGHGRLVADALAGVVGESPGQRVLGPFVGYGPRVVDGHGLPGGAAVVAAEPLYGRAARDIHLRIDLRRRDALGEFVFAGDVGSRRFVEVADKIHVFEAERGRVVLSDGAEVHAHEHLGREVWKTLFLGGHDGIPPVAPVCNIAIQTFCKTGIFTRDRRLRILGVALPPPPSVEYSQSMVQPSGMALYSSMLSSENCTPVMG